MAEPEYFAHLHEMACRLIDGRVPFSWTDMQERKELGVDLKELLTVVSILYRREVGRQAFEKFRDDVYYQPEA